ncbi:MAG: type IV secretion protein Rhs, partial [Gammaproteobacteria bacterium]|nr:type IV secretion protein Rhs [Gammaproteobacteria bacterium]
HNANNELTVYGDDITYDYDANGNMIRKSAGSVAVNYIYNVQYRLIRVEDELSGLVLAEYYYDPFGRRLWKEVDGTRTYFFYSDEGLVAEYDETGNELRSYGYQPDSTWTTDPLWLKQNGQYYWYQNDHLGTPQKLIDINGTEVWSAQYTAFGEAQVQVETVTNNLRFPGQYFDPETGLHYNWFRYYDPGIGRYLRVDPIGFGGKDV